MQTSGLKVAFIAAALLAPALLVSADEPIIPPALSRISPAGMERGTTATFKLEGRGLMAAHALLFDAPGFTAKILNVTAIHEEIKAARAGVDLEAAVPLGVKSEAQVELTVSKDAEPGIHRFRIQTPNGTSNMLPLAVGSLQGGPGASRRFCGAAASRTAGHHRWRSFLGGRGE